MRLLGTRRFWGGCIAGWALLALVESSALHFDARRAGRASALDATLLDRALCDAIWILVAAVVFPAMLRATAAQGGAMRIALRGVVLGILLAPIYTAWAPLTRTLVYGGSFTDVGQALSNTPGTTLIWDAFLYSMLTLTACMVLVSQRSRRHERNGVELRARLAQAELEILRAQLEPHFLFNALNTIAGMIRCARLDLATTALARLSELLRYVVEASRQERVPLAWELEFAVSYLELQQMRFGARLQFEIHGATVGRSCDVPPLLLQPLIENAVVHGVARTSEPVRIDVRVAMTRGTLRVEIDNTRSAHASPGGETTGVGLRNTRQRLEWMYGEDFALEAGPNGADRYRVTIALPQPAGTT